MQRVRILLTLADSYIPPPPALTLAASGLAPSRRVPCVDCGANVKRVGRCLVCDGLGWRKRRAGEPFYDEYVRQEIGVAGERERDTPTAKPRRPKKFVGESYVSRANLAARDRLDRAGSFAELRWWLERMRDEQPAGYRAIRLRYFSGLDTLTLDVSLRDEAFGVAWLARRMRGEIRVPHAEARDIARAERSSIAELHAAGLPAGTIARRLGVSKQKVRRVLRELEPIAA